MPIAPGPAGPHRWRTPTRDRRVDAHSEIDEGLWDHVRSLPVKQRKAVVLRFAGDRSYPEIAQAMSISQDLARQSVHEGLKKLRKELQ